jgi:hypothetical protein
VDAQDGRGARGEPPLRRVRDSLVRAARPAAAILVALCVAGDARARDDGSPSAATADSLVTREQARGVKEALRWIAAHQDEGSGAWGTVQDTRIADTALSLLALMAGGNTVGPGVPDQRSGLVSGPTLRGPYALNVKKGLDFLARRAWSDRETAPAGYIDGDEISKMHGHGFATLALATACGNLGARRIEDIRAQVAKGFSPANLPYADQIRWGLERAVRLIEGTQDAETGGWSYAPVPEGHEGSMTVTQITALRAAMASGVAVNGTCMKRAYDYVRNSQNTKHQEYVGGFAYQLHTKERVSYALTAAALTTFFGLGRYGDQTAGDREVIELGLKFMDRKFDDEAFSKREQWYYYRLFYAVQALYLSGDETRRQKYWPRIRDELLEANQLADGSFTTRVDESRSAEYCTAMGCLTLEVPMETIPIFQRR